MQRCAEIVRRLRFKGPVFRISGATGEGTKELCQAVMRELEELKGSDPFIFGRGLSPPSYLAASALTCAARRLLCRAALLR